MAHRIDADSLLWNWARYCWSGATVGNMMPYLVDKVASEPVNMYQALVIDRMHRTLPHHEGMIITAEYPQRNVRFFDLQEHERMQAARRWIAQITGVHLTDNEYRLYLGLFKNRIAGTLL
ncbi:hypothetical protein ERD78_18785 [Allopusillimonas soli]|uniref:Uncharacterized protein n=1 Tax=Allopusillimonas soli TaxID=659016 RepID=A0A853FLV8_9BURK|nr:hypothetical protein [Allopusillimonas soli]NYT38886.1 hypothetical protein [Allopusillimonas soli]TEA70115.1 hypothetical protein ERD78_18785 [Allopusillimonas soli]